MAKQPLSFENPVFDIKDLNLYYGDFQALKGINLQIPRKKVTALIGPSGCGNDIYVVSIDE